MRTLIRNQGSIRHLFIVAYRPLLFPVIIFLSCQIHQNVYLLLALRESIHRHSVPKLTTVWFYMRLPFTFMIAMKNMWFVF